MFTTTKNIDISESYITAREQLFDYTRRLPGHISAPENPEAYAIVREALAGKLLAIFTQFANHLPDQEELNIISLACGIPDEYLALRAFFDKRRGKQVKLNYIGMDIDAESNEINARTFQNFPEVTILSCDCSDKQAVKAALEKAKLLPAKGFEVVFIRNPDIRSPDFHKMIKQVIPFVSADSSKVFLSFYSEVEFYLAQALLDEPSFSQPRGNYLRFKTGNTICFSDGVNLEMDSISMFINCSGMVYSPPASPLPALSLLNTSNGNPHQQLRALTRKLCSGDEKLVLLLDAVKRKKYLKALHLACNAGLLALVSLILNNKETFKININEPTPPIGMTALDRLEKAAIDQRIKAQIRNLLFQHGAIDYTPIRVENPTLIFSPK